jgi:hypothetical protein
MYEAAEMRSTHPLYQSYLSRLSLDPGNSSDKIVRLAKKTEYNLGVSA